MVTDWRDKLSPDIESKLNKLLKNVKLHQRAYYDSKNPVISQLWIGLAELQNKLDLLDQRIKDIERTISESNLIKRRALSSDLRKSLDEY
jgi:uncharacterized coiled-coil protein SlyX